jgi:YaiO family outer membrane protein
MLATPPPGRLPGTALAPARPRTTNRQETLLPPTGSYPPLLTASLLAALLALGPMATAAGAQTGATLAALRQHAEQLRHDQQLPEALAAYQAVVAAEPTSFEDRFWVAKLESWTGRLDSAEAHLAGLVRERPDEYDSRLALADVRRWSGDVPGARMVLEDLRRTHPTDAEVLQRLEAMGTAPLVTRWEADLEYFGEHLPGRPATNGATLSLAARASDRLRWRGALTLQDKFDFAEYRIGGEIGFRLRQPLELRASAYVAPDATVLPRQGLGAGASLKALRRLVLYADYEFLSFADADVHQLGPGLELYAGRWLLSGRYRYSSTSYDDVAGALGNHSGTVAIGYQYGAGGLVRLFAGVGAEPLGGPSREDIGEFTGRTLGGGWRHFFTPLTGVELVYAHQARSGLEDQDSYSVRLVRRW